MAIIYPDNNTEITRSCSLLSTLTSSRMGYVNDLSDLYTRIILAWGTGLDELQPRLSSIAEILEISLKIGPWMAVDYWLRW